MIDVHHHMFPPVLTEALTKAGVDRVGGEPVAAAWTPETSLELMDRYAIDAAILSVPVPLEFADPDERRRLTREINDFGQECARRWHGRFGFFATLPLPDVEPAIEELRYALDDLGADGVALLTNHAGVYQGDQLLDPLYEELDRRGAACFIHPTLPAARDMPTGSSGSPVRGLQASLLEFPFETTRAIASLFISKTLDRFPGMRPIVTHCGGCMSSVANRLIDRRPLVTAYTSMLRSGHPPSPERIEALLEDAQRDAREHLRELHYDVALSTDTQALHALTGIVPPRRLLLGTDFPMAQEIGVHSTLAGLERFAGLASNDRNAVRSTNAARLFPRFASTKSPATQKGGPDNAERDLVIGERPV